MTIKELKQSFFYHTAVCLACIYGSTSILRILIESGADIFLNDYNISLFRFMEFQIYFYFAPIHWAAMKNQRQCAEYLIQAGADPSAHNFCRILFLFF